MALPSTMKAVRQLDPKSTKLTLDPSMTMPDTRGDYDHLLQVKATSMCLNELHWPATFPDLVKESVPGTEASAVVVKSPPDSPFQPGAEVFFRKYVALDDVTAPGCLSEYAITRQDTLARKPRNLSWEDAATVPLSSLTAWQGLFDHGTLDKRAISEDSTQALEKNAGIRVLVTGASGGVGLWLVQLAAAAGAGCVVALCSSSKADLVRGRGATEVIAYDDEGSTVESWAGRNEPVDLVVDTVGGEVLDSTWAAVRAGGTILSVSSSAGQGVRRPEGVDKEVAKAEWYLVESRGRDLEEIGRLLEEGKVVPSVDSVFEFDDYEAAFERVESRKTAGKVAIRVGALR